MDISGKQCEQQDYQANAGCPCGPRHKQTNCTKDLRHAGNRYYRSGRGNTGGTMRIKSGRLFPQCADAANRNIMPRAARRTKPKSRNAANPAKPARQNTTIQVTSTIKGAMPSLRAYCGSTCYSIPVIVAVHLDRALKLCGTISRSSAKTN